MFKFVNNVFVGKGATAADIDALNANEIALINEKGEIVTAANAADAEEIKVAKVIRKKNIVLPDGTVKANASIAELSDSIKKSEIFTPKVYSIPFALATEQEVEIDLSAAVIPADYDRIAIKVVYKDLEGTKLHMTKTFEYVNSAPIVIATAGPILAKKINKYSNGSIKAVYAANKITITALERTDNGGVDFHSTYSQTEFDTSIYLSKTTESGKDILIPGVTITTTVASSKGNGSAFIVRDMERSSLPYKGNTNFIDTIPGKPGFAVDMSKSYDTIVIEYNKKYRSSLDQQLASEPRSIQIFAESGTGLFLQTLFDAFFA